MAARAYLSWNAIRRTLTKSWRLRDRVECACDDFCELDAAAGRRRGRVLT